MILKKCNNFKKLKIRIDVKPISQVNLCAKLHSTNEQKLTKLEICQFYFEKTKINLKYLLVYLLLPIITVAIATTSTRGFKLPLKL